MDFFLFMNRKMDSPEKLVKRIEKQSAYGMTRGSSFHMPMRGRTARFVALLYKVNGTDCTSWLFGPTMKVKSPGSTT